MARQPVYEITVVYKSGAQLTFRAVDFRIERGRYFWEAAPREKFSPLLLGVDEIAAVWQREV